MHMAHAFSTDDLGRIAGLVPLIADRLGCSLHDAIEAIERSFLGNSESGVHRRNVYDYAASIRKLRLRRNAAIAPGLFRDPAWDMLLDLMVAEHDGRPICVSTLCMGSGVPLTTALRHVDRLEALEVVQRSEDPMDHRRILVRFRPEAKARMLAMVEALQDCA